MPESYNLSFTAAPLRPELARIMADAYRSHGSWDAAKHHVLATNALQSRMPRTAERFELEFRKRLSNLTDEQLALLSTATAGDAATLTWLACVKHSGFLFAFAAELLRDKLEEQDAVLRRSDYESFFETKALSHPELRRLTESSQEKVRQVSTKMLRESGLLESGSGLGTISRPLLAPEIINAVAADDPVWLKAFLMTDSEIADL